MALKSKKSICYLVSLIMTLVVPAQMLNAKTNIASKHHHAVVTATLNSSNPPSNTHSNHHQNTADISHCQNLFECDSLCQGKAGCNHCLHGCAFNAGILNEKKLLMINSVNFSANEESVLQLSFIVDAHFRPPIY